MRNSPKARQDETAWSTSSSIHSPDPRVCRLVHLVGDHEPEFPQVDPQGQAAPRGRTDQKAPALEAMHQAIALQLLKGALHGRAARLQHVGQGGLQEHKTPGEMFLYDIGAQDPLHEFVSALEALTLTLASRRASLGSLEHCCVTSPVSTVYDTRKSGDSQSAKNWP